MWILQPNFGRTFKLNLSKNLINSLSRYFGILPQEYSQIFELKEKFLQMSREEKRQHYDKDYVEVDSIPPWDEYFIRHHSKLKSQFLEEFSEREVPVEGFSANSNLSGKVAIWRGDITTLEVDAIVNAANKTLLGGGGVDGAIHQAAGPALKEECRLLNGCKTGEAKITGGYKLPAKHVIHTVGPVGEKPELLASCYSSCLNLFLTHKLTTIAFPCISTGVYGYPQEAAAIVALTTVRKFLEKNPDKVKKILFCLFLPTDVEIYENLMQVFFPVE